MKKFFRNNALSLVFIFLFVLSLGAQVYFGIIEHNRELLEAGGQPVSLIAYFRSGHFIESTFENWESEFLQMALFVLLTIFLRQKGSSESKRFDEEEEVDREPSASRKDAPWPVKKGGIVLMLYKHSLTIALLLLFIISFVLHFYGSLADENEHQLLEGEAGVTWEQYLGSSRF